MLKLSILVLYYTMWVDIRNYWCRLFVWNTRHFMV